MENEKYYNKYLKYKNKYLELSNDQTTQFGGNSCYVMFFYDSKSITTIGRENYFEELKGKYKKHIQTNNNKLDTPYVTNVNLADEFNCVFNIYYYVIGTNIVKPLFFYILTRINTSHTLYWTNKPLSRLIKNYNTEFQLPLKPEEKINIHEYYETNTIYNQGKKILKAINYTNKLSAPNKKIIMKNILEFTKLTQHFLYQNEIWTIAPRIGYYIKGINNTGDIMNPTGTSGNITHEEFKFGTTNELNEWSINLKNGKLHKPEEIKKYDFFAPDNQLVIGGLNIEELELNNLDNFILVKINKYNKSTHELKFEVIDIFEQFNNNSQEQFNNNSQEQPYSE